MGQFVDSIVTQTNTEDRPGTPESERERFIVQPILTQQPSPEDASPLLSSSMIILYRMMTTTHTAEYGSEMLSIFSGP